MTLLRRPVLRPALNTAALGLLLFGTAYMNAHAGESYVGVGLPGVVVGYALSVNQHLGLRADAGTTGSVKQNHKVSGVAFDTQAQYNRFGLFADYFPFGGRFRLTGGLTLNKARVDLASHFDGATAITVNGQSITPDASDHFDVRLSYPSTMPYIGIGWGHQEGAAGLGLVADLGVSIGRVKVGTDTNIVGKTYSGYTVTQADVDAKTDEIHDAVGRLTLLPSASMGLSYRY